MAQERILHRSFSRRMVVNHAMPIATAGAALLAGWKIADTQSWGPDFPQRPEGLRPVDLPEDTIVTGPILIQKGVNFRTSPGIPDKTRFFNPKNTVDWDDIESVNGVSLEGKDAFVVFNPVIIENGQKVDIAYYSKDENGKVRRDGGDWIKLTAGDKNNKTRPVYINDSFQTLGYVTHLLGGAFVDKISGGQYQTRVTSDAKGTEVKMSAEEFGGVGKIFLPESAEKAAGQVIPTIWQDRMRKKLDGITPLYEGVFDKHDNRTYGKEEILDAKVVASGDSFEEKTAMELAGTPVNIRACAEFLSRYITGEKVAILGQIPQGTLIKNVLFSGNEFAAFRMSDVKGAILNYTHDFKKEDTIGAIYADYLA